MSGSVGNRVGTVVQLWRYPVKSMAGERLKEVFLGRRGIPGDRGWAVFDETRQGVTNAKRIPLLRGARPRYVEEPVDGAASPPIEITLPDGTVASDLSAWLGRPVSLRALEALGAPAAARLTMDMETEETQRALSGLEPGEPEPDYSALPSDRLRALRQDNFFDAFPIHLLTTATLRTLAGIAPESTWDPRRFRMNVLVESAGNGYPELAWVGKRVRVGAAVIAVDMGCPRCSVPPQAFEELPKDPRIMRTLVRETHHVAGVYALVDKAGVVREGDTVEVLE